MTLNTVVVLVYQHQLLQTIVQQTDSNVTESQVPKPIPTSAFIQRLQSRLKKYPDRQAILASIVCIGLCGYLVDEERRILTAFTKQAVKRSEAYEAQVKRQEAYDKRKERNNT